MLIDNRELEGLRARPHEFSREVGLKCRGKDLQTVRDQKLLYSKIFLFALHTDLPDSFKAPISPPLRMEQCWGSPPPVEACLVSSMCPPHCTGSLLSWCLGLSLPTDAGVSVFYVSFGLLCCFDEGPVSLATSFKCLFDVRVPSLSPSSQRECSLLDVAMSRWHKSTFKPVTGRD